MTDQPEAELERFCAINGYVVALVMPDNRGIAFITPTLSAQAQIGISEGLEPRHGVSERYSYWTPRDAIVAFIKWTARDFAGEPTGWIRHQPSNRRRVDGDPAREEIRP